MLSNLGSKSKLDPCWVIWWALWGFMWSLEGKKKQHKAFVLRVILGDFLGLCGANVGPVWVYVGAHVGSFGGLYGVPWGLWKGKKPPNTKLFVLGVILGDFLGLCGANVGPVWVYVGAHVGSFGGLYGVPWGLWKGKKKPQHKAFCVGGYFG